MLRENETFFYIDTRLIRLPQHNALYRLRDIRVCVRCLSVEDNFLQNSKFPTLDAGTPTQGELSAGLPGACIWKMPNSVLRKEKFWISIYKFFYRLKGQLHYKFSKISTPTDIKSQSFVPTFRGQICFFFASKRPSLTTLAVVCSPKFERPDGRTARSEELRLRAGHLRYFWIFQ